MGPFRRGSEGGAGAKPLQAVIQRSQKESKVAHGGTPEIFVFFPDLVLTRHSDKFRVRGFREDRLGPVMDIITGRAPPSHEPT